MLFHGTLQIKTVKESTQRDRSKIFYAALNRILRARHCRIRSSFFLFYFFFLPLTFSLALFFSLSFCCVFLFVFLFVFIVLRSWFVVTVVNIAYVYCSKHFRLSPCSFGTFRLSLFLTPWRTVVTSTMAVDYTDERIDFFSWNHITFKSMFHKIRTVKHLLMYETCHRVGQNIYQVIFFLFLIFTRNIQPNKIMFSRFTFHNQGSMCNVQTLLVLVYPRKFRPWKLELNPLMKKPALAYTAACLALLITKSLLLIIRRTLHDIQDITDKADYANFYVLSIF